MFIGRNLCSEPHIKVIRRLKNKKIKTNLKQMFVRWLGMFCYDFGKGIYISAKFLSPKPISAHIIK